jgi:hypothetical protein
MVSSLYRYSILISRHRQQTEWNEIRSEYSQKLLAMFLAGHPNHQLVFMRIWQIRPAYLTSAFAAFYKESPLNITRILDVAQDLKASAQQCLQLCSFDGHLDPRCAP